MTRQWVVPPAMMCLSHRLGEHAETHMFLKKMEKHHSLQGFRDGSMFFGAEFLLKRHELLAAGLSGHKSPLIIRDQIDYWYPYIEPTREDILVSGTTLFSRCPNCMMLFYEAYDTVSKSGVDKENPLLRIW